MELVTNSRTPSRKDFRTSKDSDSKSSRESSVRSSKDHGSRASSGRLSAKGPSHSTPVKGDRSKSQSINSITSTPSSTPGRNRCNDSRGQPSTAHYEPYHEDSNLTDLELNNTTKTSERQKRPPRSDHQRLSLGTMSGTTFRDRTMVAALGAGDWMTYAVDHSLKTGGVAAQRKLDSNGVDQSNCVLSSTQQAKVTDFENQTIQKQRQELSLLVAELRDRDHELNDMVASHKQQLTAWEQDRQKIMALEEKGLRLEREIHNRNDEIRSLRAKLRVIECADHDKSTALNNTQEQLVLMSEQQSQASIQLHDLEQRNKSLSVSVRDMSCTVGQLEAREQELLTVLQLKDRDLSEAATHMAELGARLKKMDLQHKEAKTGESDFKRKVTEWKNKHADQQREVEYTKKLLQRSEQRNDEQHVEIQKLRQDNNTLRKEVALSAEREKRKDQLLDLQRSKQDRSDAEVNNIRQLYERQQKDLSLLHVNLENTKELLYKNNISVPGMGSIGLPEPLNFSRMSQRPTAMDRAYQNYARNMDCNGGGLSYDLSPGQQTKESSYHSAVTTDYEDTGFSFNKSTEDTMAGNSTSQSLGLDDEEALDIQAPQTPPSRQSSAALKALHLSGQTRVTDSPATKLHRLLTESKDMVAELEHSVSDKDASERSTGQPEPETTCQDLREEASDDHSSQTAISHTSDDGLPQS